MTPRWTGRRRSTYCVGEKKGIMTGAITDDGTTFVLTQVFRPGRPHRSVAGEGQRPVDVPAVVEGVVGVGQDHVGE